MWNYWLKVNKQEINKPLKVDKQIGRKVFIGKWTGKLLIKVSEDLGR